MGTQTQCAAIKWHLMHGVNEGCTPTKPHRAGRNDATRTRHARTSVITTGAVYGLPCSRMKPHCGRASNPGINHTLNTHFAVQPSSAYATPPPPPLQLPHGEAEQGA
jgi:hypothetical protein